MHFSKIPAVRPLAAAAAAAAAAAQLAAEPQPQTGVRFVPTKCEKMHFFINFFNFMEKVHFFTFSRYELIWGKIKKNEYFSFVLKVNRKKVRCTHPRAQKNFFED